MRWWVLALVLLLPLLSGCQRFGIQWTSAPPQAPSYPAVVLLARDDLAGRLGIDPSEVAITSYEAVEWPDACIGIYEPNIGCAMVLTSGYRVTLQALGAPCVYHTGFNYVRPHPLQCPQAAGT